jgi:HEAT repeat protein
MELLRRYRAALLGLWLLCAPGCKHVPASWYYAWNGYPKEEIETPFQRSERYRQFMAGAWTTPNPETTESFAADLATETDPLVRAEIVRSLATLKGQAADDALARALNDPHEHVRIASCHALGRRGGATSLQALGGVLKNEQNVDVRLAAVQSMGKIQDPQAVVPVLASALEDSNVAVQNRAMASLEQVTGRDYGRDVNAWRSFAQGQDVPQQHQSIAERFRKLF